MADIISFKRARSGRQSSEAGDINELLKRATLISKEDTEFIQDKIGVVGTGKLRMIFEKKITEAIIKSRRVGSDTLLCGIYVSKLLDEFAVRHPESWWAIDYANSENPLTLKKGGDTCFLICGVFPERGNIRMMDISYYQKIGAGFYNRFYNMTSKEIGYHMSQHFNEMAQVVRNCIQHF